MSIVSNPDHKVGGSLLLPPPPPGTLRVKIRFLSGRERVYLCAKEKVNADSGNSSTTTVLDISQQKEVISSKNSDSVGPVASAPTDAFLLDALKQLDDSIALTRDEFQQTSISPNPIEDLSEMIEPNGVIRKSTSAIKSYSDLLSHAHTFTSRDLSIALDPLSKTKTHSVLLDFVHHNGFARLHDILRLNISNFQRTPIIRKTLKILETLAQKNIFTLDNLLNTTGNERFHDTIAHLAEHKDIQVHLAARKFRDTWLPRTHKSITSRPHMEERHYARYPAHQSPAEILGKRKRGWDHTPEYSTMAKHRKIYNLQQSEHRERRVSYGVTLGRRSPPRETRQGCFSRQRHWDRGRHHQWDRGRHRHWTRFDHR